jgi:hypothetical protein
MGENREMSVLRRAAVVAVALVSGVAATVAVAGPAHAADYKSCPDESGYLCFWQNGGYTGAMGKLSGTNRTWSSFSRSGCPTGTWDNCASAIRNEGLSCEAVVYRDPFFGGPSWVINRDTSAAWLSSWSMEPGKSWDDQISSNSWWCG